ncbi:hypothetical protein GCM10009737_01770 [Nocardioides lentus]|uniref:Uncharacterized protein n=1 Tax=Nocardioides lentus TaxID=338077 RepID=A0ABN2NVV0_9ACTN
MHITAAHDTAFKARFKDHRSQGCVRLTVLPNQGLGCSEILTGYVPTVQIAIRGVPPPERIARAGLPLGCGPTSGDRPVGWSVRGIGDSCHCTKFTEVRLDSVDRGSNAVGHQGVPRFMGGNPLVGEWLVKSQVAAATALVP